MEYYLIGIGFIAYNKLNEKPERIAVVMADVDESHSAAFKYGMKMAASEYGVDVVMISKENLNNMSDEIDVINQEINKKADAVVFKPTAEKMTEEKMAAAVQPERKEIVTDVFVRGAKKGWGIAIGSMLPNVVMAFVIIKALDITGILTLVGNTCGPVMEIFGLPGKAIVVLLGAWLSAGGGVGTAIALHSSGALNGTDLAILTPAIFLMGSQVQYLGRVLGVIGVSGKMVPIIMTVPVIVAILSLWVMRLIVLAS